VTALRGLATQVPVADLTVDQVAEAAGISRRTFFNYFPGIPAVLSAVFSGYTATLSQALPDLEPGGRPLEQIRAVLRRHGVPRGLIEWIALLNCHDSAGGESVLALERQVWTEQEAWLQDQLRRRLAPGTDPLFVATLSGTVLNAFASAEQVWLAGRSPRSTVSDADADAYLDLVDRALGHALTGWAPTPTGTP
jgi:AcrR family transcriptional regulator